VTAASTTIVYEALRATGKRETEKPALGGRYLFRKPCLFAARAIAQNADSGASHEGFGSRQVLSTRAVGHVTP